MNNVQLIGRLTKDAELRYSPGGLEVTRFTLAVDRRMSKEKKMDAESRNLPTADFISCVGFGSIAETIANYTVKGRRIGVEGRIQTGSYEKDGQRFYTTDVVVNNFEFLESPNAPAPQQTSQQAQIEQKEDDEVYMIPTPEDIPF